MQNDERTFEEMAFEKIEHLLAEANHLLQRLLSDRARKAVVIEEGSPSDMLSVLDASRAYGVSKTRIFQHIRHGRLPHMTDNRGRHYVRRSDLANMAQLPSGPKKRGA